MYNLNFWELVFFCCRRCVIFNLFYELNEVKIIVRLIVGDIYNEMENEFVSFKDLIEYIKFFIFIIYFMFDKVKYFLD